MKNSKALSGRTINIVSDNEVIIRVPLNVYSKDAILRACYEYCDLAFAKIESNKTSFIIELKRKDDKTRIRELTDKFCNDLIDFELRTIIASQTQDIRSALIRNAFPI